MADINTELVRRVINRFENDPRLWCRNGCRDEDGHLCLPAMAADLSGGVWAGKAGGELGGYLHAEPGDDPAQVLHLIHPHDRAQRVIRTDMPFNDDLTLGQFRRLLKP